MNIHIPLWLLYGVIGIFVVLEIIRIVGWIWFNLMDK